MIGQRFDPASRHTAADLFVSLEPGCYEILAVPASALRGDAFTASADCGRARSGQVRVRRGRTAIASLLPQCEGDRLGHRDVLSSLNRPPTVSLEADAVSTAAGEPVRACAIAWDPDDDPVAISFSTASAHDGLRIVVDEPTVAGFADGHRLWQACADLVGPGGAYEVRAEVHDLGWSLGRMVRLEELVAPARSHASLTFPLEVVCTESLCS